MCPVEAAVSTWQNATGSLHDYGQKKKSKPSASAGHNPPASVSSSVRTAVMAVNCPLM